MAEGLALIRGSRALLTVLIAWNVSMLGNAGVNVAEVALAKVSFHAGDFGFGLMLASAGFGLVFGSLGSRVLDRATPARWRLRRWLRADGARDRSRRIVAGHLGCGRVRCRLGRRERDRARLQCPARPARGTRPVARPSIHCPHELELRRARAGHGRRGPLTNEFGARWVWGASACLSALAGVVGFALARGIGDAHVTRVVEAEA